MRPSTLLSTFSLICASGTLGASIPEAVTRLRAGRYDEQGNSAVHLEDTPAPAVKRAAPSVAYDIPTFANPLAAKFQVNTSSLPLVNFSLPETWAGRLSISPANTTTRELFFWYFPSTASNGSDSLTIWLNGGPGCSSLEGALEENGPLHLNQGSPTPVFNEYAWTNASDMLYIEQPVGVGFDVGSPNISNEIQLADEFYGFLGNFYEVFSELKAKKLYVAGESYAGFYIPYVAVNLLQNGPSLGVALHAILINDGVYSSFVTSEQIPVHNFSATNQAILGFNDSFIASLKTQSEKCGYEQLWESVSYPPKGKYVLPHGDNVPSGCDLFDEMINEAIAVNPCFNIYRITDKCPTPSDPIQGYMNKAAVQSALHVSGSDWVECSNGNVFLNGVDNSAYTETLFPGILEQIPVYLWHGYDDSILFWEGDRITIQNLTWNGAQGFQTEPSTPLTYNGKTYGIKHSERNLTYMEVDNSGHMIPQDQPELALHVLQAVLGQTTL